MSAAAAAPSGPRVLLVEDSETQALQMRLLLEHEGFAVAHVGSAEAALEAMAVADPDLLMVDYHLPGMNGDELVRIVRLNRQTRALPVLMLTGGATRELERQGLDSGASAYVPKSAERALLLGRVRALRRQPRAGERGPAEGFRRARTLLVSGDPAYLDAGTALLSGEGYLVHRAADPGAAAASIARGSVDCVLIDGDGTGFDGLALAERLAAARNASRGFEIVMLVSAAAGTDLALRGLAAGADDVLLKTDDRQTLAARIRAVVRRKLARDEEARAAAHERAREAALARARAEAAGAEALAAANHELAAANERLSATQAQLVQAAKMASLGELVAGIAHEINNPLAFILAHQATVRRLVEETAAGLDEGRAARLARAGQRLDAMGQGLGRIQQLVVKLRRFSRLDEGERMAVDVPEAIDAVLTLLAPKLGRDIVVERRYDAPATLTCSAALINQVVMNILANAADALPGGGRIAIATSVEGDRYRIAIGDDGPGVPPHARGRVFEPFFTTKEIGVGTGLGLAIAYGVVRSHGGEIAIGDGPLGGALFTVTVPVTPP